MRLVMTNNWNRFNDIHLKTVFVSFETLKNITSYSIYITNYTEILHKDTIKL